MFHFAGLIPLRNHLMGSKYSYVKYVAKNKKLEKQKE